MLLRKSLRLLVGLSMLTLSCQVSRAVSAWNMDPMTNKPCWSGLAWRQDLINAAVTGKQLAEHLGLLELKQNLNKMEQDDR